MRYRTRHIQPTQPSRHAPVAAGDDIGGSMSPCEVLCVFDSLRLHAGNAYWKTRSPPPGRQAPRTQDLASGHKNALALYSRVSCL